MKCRPRSLEKSGEICYQYSRATGPEAFDIDYQLAPQNRHCTTNEDCWAAFYWFQNVEKVKIDPDRMAVGGISVGGYLSAVTANGKDDISPQALPGSASTSKARGGLENQLYASFQLRSRTSSSVHSGNGPSTRRRGSLSWKAGKLESCIL
ncbi:hypothetical protein RU639_006897 [Aspergillus parasiticus]